LKRQKGKEWLEEGEGVGARATTQCRNRQNNAVEFSRLKNMFKRYVGFTRILSQYKALNSWGAIR